MASDKLDELLALAKSVKMTSQDREQQRRSFAYGNTKIENRDITKDTIDQAATAINHADQE